MLQFTIVAIMTVFIASCAHNQSRGIGVLTDLPKLITIDDTGQQQKEYLSDFTSMLVNEFASIRDPEKISIDSCIQAATNNEDVALSQRCYQMSLQFSDTGKHLQAATHWAAIDQHNPVAYQVLAQAYISNHQYDKGFDTLLHAKQRGLDVDMTSVATHAIFLYGDEGDHLIHRYRQARMQYPDDQSILLGEIILQTRKSEQNYYIGKYKEALTSFEALIAFDTNQRINDEEIFFERPYLFESRSLRQLHRSEQAIVHLERAIARHPDYVTLYIELIDLYLEKNNLTQAEAITNRLLDSNDSADVFFQAGQVIARSPMHRVQHRIEQRFLSISKDSQTDMEQRELALFRLGVLADLMGNQEKKRYYLEQIRHTPQLVVAATSELASMLAVQEGVLTGKAYFVSARQRWPQLVESLWQAEVQWLAKDDRSQAIALLNQIIATDPSESLIFTRGLYHALDGNIPAMEKDFKHILASNPLHVDTLNAYGYTLVDMTDRIEEGSKMINRAFALDSERPAIVDSLGWSYFRQGKLQQALVLIHWAYSHMQDGEIGAHYGEILWHLGHTNEARLLLNQELAREPDNAILLDTYQRLFHTDTP